MYSKPYIDGSRLAPRAPLALKMKMYRVIEVVSKYNIEEVLPLIRGYMQFYKIADICDSRNREFFCSLMNPTLLVASSFSVNQEKPLALQPFTYLSRHQLQQRWLS